MAQKFIISADGVLRFGSVYLHKELLAPNESWCYGGGFWHIDHERGSIALYGRSFDFGLPNFEQVRRIDWTGVGGRPHTLLYLPQWPDERVTIPVTAKRQGEEEVTSSRPTSDASEGSHGIRILVTGATGFLGSRVAWYLEQVCGYTVYTPSHQEMELTNVEACSHYIASCQPHYVVHGAAISSTAYCQQHPEESKAVNVEGTCNVVRAAKEQGARCIYMSSDQVYQNDTNEWTQTFKEEETDLMNHPPRSIYGRDKLEMENLAQAIDPTAIGLRLTWMYDSHDSSSMPLAPERLKKDHGIMANLIKTKLEGSAIKACTHERRGITDVWEVVKDIAALISKGDAEGGIYNCGEECSCTTYERYLQLAESLGISPLLIVPDDSWSRSLAMNTAKLRASISSSPNETRCATGRAQ